MTEILELNVCTTFPELRGGHRPDKVHTSLTKLLEKGVVVRDLYGETLRVENQLADGSRAIVLTALDTRGVVITESEEWSVGDVVVHELSPLHHVVGVQLTGGVHVRDDVDAHQAGGGQGSPGLALPGSEHSVTVLRQEGSLEGSVGGAPQRVVHIITGTCGGQTDVITQLSPLILTDNTHRPALGIDC